MRTVGKNACRYEISEAWNHVNNNKAMYYCEALKNYMVSIEIGSQLFLGPFHSFDLVTDRGKQSFINNSRLLHLWPEMDWL